MKKSLITIVDYGVGNVYSLTRAFSALGIETVISEDAEMIRKSDGVVLPGVGAFAAGMRGLAVRGLTDVIQEIGRANKPILGICLGAQLLLSKGFEFGEYEGLGLIPGKVVHFPPLADQEKVPQVGWNNVYKKNQSWNKTVLDGLDNRLNAYFVHSYILEPEDPKHALGFTRYGGYEFCSVIQNGAMFGCQFHPEKSGLVGLQIIQNFITMVRLRITE